MKKLIEKNETLVCIILIVSYLVINSLCRQKFGTTDYRSAIINFIYAAALLLLIVKSGRVRYYGLTGVDNAGRYLYFVPLVVISSVNLWNGFNCDNTLTEILWHVLTMCCVGFIEEVIFRGFLFKMMAKSNLKSAMLVSSLTFGIGHIINLLTGADFVPTLLQVCYAVALGYLFVVIFYKSKSLMPCIISHAVINSLSILDFENRTLYYVVVVFLIVAPLLYAAYINKAEK